MLSVFCIDNNKLHEQDRIKPGCWVQLSDPSTSEIDLVATTCDVPAKALQAPLDLDEPSYLDITGTYSLITIDIPAHATYDGAETFTTLPLCAIATESNVITSCLHPLHGFQQAIDHNLEDLSTDDHHQFVFRLLIVVAEVYQKRLREVEAERAAMEAHLGTRTDNRELRRLHQLETTLVYFETSLRANRLTLDRIQNSERMPLSADDRELLKEVGRETDQAIEMATLYRSIIQSTRDLFASVLDNGLNSVMKRLTSLTIILAVPTIIGGFYGMNVAEEGIPLSGSTLGFAVVVLASTAVCVALGIWLRRKRLM